MYRLGSGRNGRLGKLESSCSSWVRQEEHTSAFRAGCNGGNSWSYLGRRIRDFIGMTSKLGGKRYRRSTKETDKKRAGKIAALRLSQAMGGTGLLDGKARTPQGFSTRFLSWVECEFRGRCHLVRYGESSGKTPRLVRAFGAHADDRGTRKVPPLPGALRPADRGEDGRRSSVNSEFLLI